MTVDEQLDLIRRGTSEIISEQELKAKLESGRTLRVKLGVDPTVAHVTLGWAVVLRKLRDFQRLGHTACLIIGDFTAQIGDPSGKSKTRPQLTREEVERNVEAVSHQVYKILDHARTEVFFNADWLGKMGFADVIRLCSRTTVARIMERDDFTKRWTEHRPISLHEILYPLCQGQDSVEVRADIELGGNDQKFNNLVGRDLQAAAGQEPQVIVLSPLLIGTDGKEKMSQSLGNYVSVVDPPNDMYGKTMSIPDTLLDNWFELCTDVPMAEARALIAKNPYEAKKRLAREIVALYHSEQAAQEGEEYFATTFSKREQPVEAETATIPAETVAEGTVALANLIAALGLAKSNGNARDLIKQGGVSIGGEKVSDPFVKLGVGELDGKVLRVGKHQFRKLAAPAS
ncbi:MAG: tyrosine--tRNA ligase [Fimbriimonadaceae bacterium]|nr:tyrosine--tRNA ligase [Fimbriimonadaceae bacterium]QYK57550.1 MAG: tyrosine--tRNA ligase [Fimbriimonadaceae bacterium]